MKKIKIIYWIATGLLSLMMMFSAFAYFTSLEVKASFTQLGFLPIFRIELGIAKILGVLVLLLPFVPARIKEWAYAGFFITFISALLVHLAIHDPAGKVMAPVFAMILLAVSYWSQYRLQKINMQTQGLKV